MAGRRPDAADLARDAALAPARSRTPEQIRASIEANRAELGAAVERLRTQATELADWRGHLRRHRSEVADRRGRQPASCSAAGSPASAAACAAAASRRADATVRRRADRGRRLAAPWLPTHRRARADRRGTIARIFFTVVLFAGVLYLVYLVRDVVVLLFIALFLAVALGPAVDFFHRRKIPRPLSILIVYLLGLLASSWSACSSCRRSSTRSSDVAKQAPQYIKDIRNNPTLREYDDKYNITQKLERAGQQAAVACSAPPRARCRASPSACSRPRSSSSPSCRSRSSCCSTASD